MLCEKTLAMTAGAGFLIKLCPPDAESDAAFTGVASRVSLLAKAECYVQFVNWDGVSDAPIAPTVSPAPVAGAQAAFLRMLASETIHRGAQGQTWQKYSHIRVWAIAAGDLLVDAE